MNVSLSKPSHPNYIEYILPWPYAEIWAPHWVPFIVGILFGPPKKYLLLQNPIYSLEGEWKKLLVQKIPTVWAEDSPPGLVKHVLLLIVHLTPEAIPF